MADIIESLIPPLSTPQLAIEPFHSDSFLPIYSSIPVTQPDAQCFPCIVCGVNSANQFDKLREIASAAALRAEGSLNPSSGSVVLPGQENDFDLNTVPIVFLPVGNPPQPPDPPDPPVPPLEGEN